MSTISSGASAPAFCASHYFKDHERTLMFIDGHYSFHATRALGRTLDFAKLLELIKNNSDFIRAIYFFNSAVSEYNSAKPVLDWLSYNGYTVEERVPESNGVSSSDELDVGVDITLALATLPRDIDNVVLLSGNGNLIPAINFVKKQGVRVTVLFFDLQNNKQPRSIASLKRVADRFLDLTSIIDYLVKNNQTIGQMMKAE